jgi:hypothetical protein
LLLHLHSPHPLLHLHFDPSPVLALPRAPCIVIVDNAPMNIRWIWPPPCLYLVPIGFGFGISFVHIRNFFISIDVLLWKKPFQCKQPCVLAARGGTRISDDVVCYLGIEHSPRPTVDCWSRCSWPSRTTKFDNNYSRPYLWRDFCAL